jgi:hypothetical protein
MSASVELERKAVRLNVTCHAGDTVLEVWRSGPSGVEAFVRGWAPGTVVGATPVIVRDYEAPLGVPLHYFARCGATPAGYGAAAGPVAITVAVGECECWLVDLARPINSIQVTAESLPELAYSLEAGVHFVMGRRAPVMTSLPAHTPAGELTVLTDDLATREEARAILGSGYPFLLRTAPDWGIGNLYCGVTGFVEGRIVTDGAAPYRRWRASVQQVERPDPLVFTPTPPNTWAAVKASFATWATVLSSALTWDALANTYPAVDPEAQPVVPWPPDDV